MTIFRLNPLALTLCLVVVLALGFMMVTMTDPLTPQYLKSSDAQEFGVLTPYGEAVPPPQEADAPQAAVRLPRVEFEPSTSAPSLPGGPDIAPTAAPGVAFNYRYAFRLPAERIPQVQEQHAQACERLGVGRCRITGLRYRVADAQNIEAMLALSLAPDIARRFGRDGIAAITRAEGELVDAEISGVDADRAIRESGRDLVRLREDLRRIEQRLAQRLGTEERLRLDDQAEQLRRLILAAESGRDEQRESLANTPMLFQYGAGELAPVETRPSLGAASKSALDNFLEGMTILAIIGVTLLPWTLLALALWLTWRIARRRLGAPVPQSKPTASPA